MSTILPTFTIFSVIEELGVLTDVFYMFATDCQANHTKVRRELINAYPQECRIVSQGMAVNVETGRPVGRRNKWLRSKCNT